MTAFTGPLRGDRLSPPHADALFKAFAGVAIYADPIAAAFPGLAAADPDAAMVTATTLAETLGDRTRWAGLRDEVTAAHAIAMTLRAKLDENPIAVPDPDAAIVEALRTQPGFAMVGKVVTIHGVPVPAGKAQTGYYVALRWLPLFSPLADLTRVYRGDTLYDAANVTDELQESLLLVSTRIYLNSLVLLQRTAPALFIALWLRDEDAIETLLATTPVAALPPRFRRSRNTNLRKCLRIQHEALSEWERAFDLLGALKSQGGVTSQTVTAVLASTTCMTAIYAVPDATRRHVAAGTAHVRTVHPFMSAREPDTGSDPVLQAVKAGIEASRVHQKQYRHVTWVGGAMPTRFFIGIEPMFVIAVALIHMREVMETHEGKFWLGGRGQQDKCVGTLATRTISLAVLVTSTICAPTARAMLRDNGLLLDTAWLRRDVMPLLNNPRLEDELRQAGKIDVIGAPSSPLNGSTGISNRLRGGQNVFKSIYEGAQERATKCSAPVGQPGWTQGFRQLAWRNRRAETRFLRNCCRFVRYRKKLVPKEQQWRAVLDARGHAGHGVDVLAAIETGLPQQHMVERVQDMFRPQFNRLEVAELVHGSESSESCLLREALIGEIAPLLAGLSPITDDPALNERFWVDRQSEDVRIAAQGAWNI